MVTQQVFDAVWRSLVATLPMCAGHGQPARRMSQPDQTRFEYFLLQARRGASDDRGSVRVTLEDLASGDRWDFTSPMELARFIETGRTTEFAAMEPGTDAGSETLPPT